MIHILVVDDEPINADGIAQYLELHGPSDWVIRTAYSAQTALERARERVDVLVADIVMPGMDGFALCERVSALWPQTQVIFLTGNPHFDFVQRAIRTGTIVDYILKNEPESVVLEAIDKAVRAQEVKIKAQDLLQSAQQEVHKALPILRKDFCLRLLRDSQDPNHLLPTRFKELEMPLDPDELLLLLLGRLQVEAPGGEDLAFFALDNLFDKYLWPTFRRFTIRPDERDFVCFLQTGAARSEETVRYTFSLLEVAQQAFPHTIGAVALVLDGRFTCWTELANRYPAVRRTLERHALLMEDALMIHSDPDADPDPSPHAGLAVMRAKMDRGDYAGAAAVLGEIEDPATPRGKIDLYRRLLKLISLSLDALDDVNTGGRDWTFPAPRLDPDGWHRVKEEFSAMITRLDIREESARRQVHQLLETVNKYVDENLGDDLSLTRMSALVHHSPTYFSKIFKAAAGVGYADYIISKRMERAASLLLDTSERVSNIARQVGYGSVSYFISAYRRQFGVTPADFRKNG